jgi:WXG100 family type VII secretion target
MSNPFAVSYGSLGDSLAQLQAQTQQLEQIVEDVQSRVSASFASWDGQAQLAYQAAQTQWNSAMTDMASRLALKASSGSQAMENYSVADRASAQGF